MVLTAVQLVQPNSLLSTHKHSGGRVGRRVTQRRGRRTCSHFSPASRGRTWMFFVAPHDVERFAHGLPLGWVRHSSTDLGQLGGQSPSWAVCLRQWTAPAAPWASWVVSRHHCGLLRQWTAPAAPWASWVVSRRHCGLLRQWTAPAAPWANRIVLPHRGPLGLGAGIRGNSLG